MRLMFLLFFALAALSHGFEPEAHAIVRRWIDAGKGVQSLEIDFVQERQLRTLRKPLSRPGKIWFQRSGSFRWQIGAPPTMIAAQKSGGDLQVADTKEKKLRTWTAAELAAETANGGGQGFAMAGAGFPTSFEAFEKTFEIKSATETKEPGVWEVSLDLRDKKAGIVVKDVLFTIVPADGSLRQFEIQMRDGSLLRTRVLAARKNQPLPEAVFKLDTSGYTVEP